MGPSSHPIEDTNVSRGRGVLPQNLGGGVRPASGNPHFIFYVHLTIDTGYEGGNLLVAFYNGQTEQLSPGVAVRIPLAVFDRIVTELQLPESQRRKIRLAADMSTPPYQGRPPPLHTTWQRPFSPPRQPKQATPKHGSKEALSDKIKSQLERNRHLLERVHFNEEEGMEDNLSDTNTEELDITDHRHEPETIDVGVGTEDLGEYVQTCAFCTLVVIFFSTRGSYQC